VCAAFGSAESIEDLPQKYEAAGKIRREGKLARKPKKKPRLKPEVASEAEDEPSWWDDSWHWAGLGLTFGVSPFALVSLTYPSWTGSAGTWLAGGLYQAFGISALILPAVTTSLGLHLLLPRSHRPIQLSWAPTLLWVDLIWVSQRMGGQGGWLGSFIDSLAVAAVGPLGSWMGAGLGLGVTSLAVCRVSLRKVVRQLAAGLVHHLDGGLRWAASVKIPAWRWPQAQDRELPEPSLEESGEALSQETLSQEADPRPRKLAFPLKVDKEPEVITFQKPVRQQPVAAEPTMAAPAGVAPVVAPPVEALLVVAKPGVAAPAVAASAGAAPALAPSVEPEAEPMEDLPDAAEISWEEQSELAGQELPGEVQHEAPEEDSEQDFFSEDEEQLEAVMEPDGEVPGEGPKGPEAQEVQIALKPAGIYVEADGQLRLFPSAERPKKVAYRLPPLSLLDELPLSYQRPQIEDKSQVLLDSLASFGVQASLLAIVQGPTVTRYELQPARGVKVNRFTSLTNDIALALAAKAVRIEAPIPGKSAIGIEIPNDNTELVVLRDILGAPKFRKSTGMSIALGKDLSGTPTFAPLQKMPHLLVAGTTGSGKSVCINALIMSLLYRFTPRELQLLMIDPKQVELSIYEGIPHLISLAKGTGDSKNEGAIICDPKRAALALNQIVELMEFRYGLFAAARVRNLDEYNQGSEDPLPWVVVLIDELADLMMVASKSVETSICRIAQKARAAGIHLVLATQRPSADVITGLIKVNVPSRIAFAVSSQVDSRVILDTGGAEQLLGKGDMLFCPVDASDPRRLQGCFVSNDEILRVVEWWRAQASPDNRIELKVGEVAEEASDDEEGADVDGQLVEQALQVVLRRQQASASLLQTELKVGYARARRLIYLMEKKGYIGPAEGSKPRKILAT